MQHKINEIDVKTCYNKVKEGNAILIDVRELDEVEGVSYNVPNRIDIPLSKFEKNIGQIPQDKLLIIACRRGIRSYDVTNYLSQNNFKNVYNLKGGIIEWAREQLPINGDINNALH